MRSSLWAALCGSWVEDINRPDASRLVGTWPIFERFSGRFSERDSRSHDSCARARKSAGRQRTGMKLLLDESIARKLTNSFLGHECSTMSEEGLGREEERGTSGTRGRMRLSAFLTLDRGIEYQQNLKPRNIAVILIRTKSNRLADLLVHVPEILRVLESVQSGQLAKVGQ
jgi:hypothetical protein